MGTAPSATTRWIMRSGLLILLILLVAVLAIGVSRNDYYASVVFQICFWSTVGCAYNVSAGYAGDLSLGHGAFLGLGAYTSTLLFMERGISPWIGMVVGAVLAGILAVILGTVAVRLRGPYYSIVTLAVVMVLGLVASGWPSLTKGDIGISISGDSSVANLILADPAGYVLIAFVMLLAMLVGCRWLVRSRLGFQLAAYRENEDAARSLGIATTRVRVIALAVSAIVTAIAGSVQAQYVGFISPTSEFSLGFSVQVAVVTIIGGLGTVYGPIFGAILIVVLNERLAPLVQHAAGLNQVVFGVILIVVLLFFRRGIAGLGDALVGVWRRRVRPAPARPPEDLPRRETVEERQ